MISEMYGFKEKIKFQLNCIVYIRLVQDFPSHLIFYLLLRNVAQLEQVQNKLICFTQMCLSYIHK